MQRRLNPRPAAVIAPAMVIAALTGCSAPEAPNDAAAVATIHADYPVYDSEQAVSDAADTVIRGIVRSSKSELVPLVPDMGGDDPLSNPQAGLSKREKAAFLAEGHGYVATKHTVEVTEVLRGIVDVGDTVTVEQLGGLQDGTRYVVEGVDQMAIGEHYLLFANDQPGDALNVINLEQGIYTVGSDGALVTLAEDPGGYLVETIAEARQVLSE